MNHLKKAVNEIEAILFQSMPFSEIIVQLASPKSSSEIESSHAKNFTLSQLYSNLKKTDLKKKLPEFSEDMDIKCFTAYEDGTVCL